MMNRSIRLAALVMMLCAGAPSAPAAACGLEGGPGNSFGAAYPGSVEVAFAAHDAINAGMLVPDAALDPALAHDRADDRLRSLAAALPVRGSAAGVAVLLVETGTWTRLTSRGGVWVVTEHADGPQSGDAALIASELALRDLTAGQLTANKAMTMGLLSVHELEPLASALKQAYPERPESIAQRQLEIDTGVLPFRAQFRSSLPAGSSTSRATHSATRVSKAMSNVVFQQTVCSIQRSKSWHAKTSRTS